MFITFINSPWGLLLISFVALLPMRCWLSLDSFTSSVSRSSKMYLVLLVCSYLLFALVRSCSRRLVVFIQCHSILLFFGLLSRTSALMLGLGVIVVGAIIMLFQILQTPKFAVQNFYYHRKFTPCLPLTLVYTIDPGGIGKGCVDDRFLTSR